ncbi:tRNA pseudouridine(55) synthase TruB [Helicobacter bilis]|uniref:tRNA pseudouridine(55) synthase n=2 Tax=Helicobacter bilis TaxID=37372 RepID=A0A4U8U9H6_9HELI|nr:tRNA pseudouridine(55) synthase TruB [Helicobacter bilis]TLE10065.1 tRNA pseudouridine(55) synthase TruB [Helicobacter bilis]
MPQNFFAIASKPPNISSLSFANMLKKGLKGLGYPVKKIGFSGTLDPFAHGMLILGINNYTKLLSHIKKDYKTYKAVLFLGLESKSLDIENIVCLHKIQPYSHEEIEKAIQNMQGNISYKPPKFSAKHINGVRAYELMRKGIDFDISTITTDIKYIKILNYSHPFLSFEVCVSEGGYIRSIGEIIAKNLGICGSLCSLERVQEGEWNYKNMLKDSMTHKQNNVLGCIEVPLQIQGIRQNAKVIILNIKNALKYDTIQLTEYAKIAYNGAKFILNPSLCAKIFSDMVCVADSKKDSKQHTQQSQNIQATHLESGCHNKEVCPDTMCKDSVSKILLADFDTHFGIIEVFQDGKVKYILNRIDKC